jgi:hypothetical protein
VFVAIISAQKGKKGVSREAESNSYTAATALILQPNLLWAEPAAHDACYMNSEPILERGIGRFDQSYHRGK